MKKQAVGHIGLGIGCIQYHQTAIYIALIVTKLAVTDYCRSNQQASCKDYRTLVGLVLEPMSGRSIALMCVHDPAVGSGWAFSSIVDVP